MIIEENNSNINSDRKRQIMKIVHKRNLNLSAELQKNSLINQSDEDYHINRYSIPKGLQIIHSKSKIKKRIFQNKYSQEIEGEIIHKGKLNSLFKRRNKTNLGILGSRLRLGKLKTIYNCSSWG